MLRGTLKPAKGKGEAFQATEQQVQKPRSETEIYLLDKRKAGQCDWSLTRETPLEDAFCAFRKSNFILPIIWGQK